VRAVIADDDPVTMAILSKALKRWDLDVMPASDGARAWELLTSAPVPDLAIIDWMMPGLDGIELCQRIRREPRLAGIYVLLLTGRGSRADLVAGLDAGADDYMVKPIDTEELRARVQVGIRVATLQARLADRVADLQSASTELTRLVSTDVLTDLCSRRSWFERAGAEFSRSQRYGRDFALLLIDLDLFKHVNDTFGHDAGDRLLRAVGDRLKAECRQSDIIGRLGGEEFAVLTPETTGADAERMASRIQEACRRVVVATSEGDVRCTCSIGVSALTPQDDDVEVVLRRADAALYEAKRSGRNCWKRYGPNTASFLLR
jgi:diguanylate cyclase (GGDEF)-like protein